MNSRLGLSVAQRDMLKRIAASTYGEHCVFPRGQRTARVLVRKGLLRPLGQGWYGITGEGRRTVGAGEQLTPRGQSDD